VSIVTAKFVPAENQARQFKGNAYRKFWKYFSHQETTFKRIYFSVKEHTVQAAQTCTPQKVRWWWLRKTAFTVLQCSIELLK